MTVSAVASGADGVTLLVLAKAPRPGRVKTRLCPPCGPDEAAAIAEASLRDTLDAVLVADVADRVVVLDGPPGPWLNDGLRVVAQSGGGLDRRLGAAFAGVDGPALLIGMDTPQVTPQVLTGAAELLLRMDAVIGHAADGGWWVLGLRRPDPSLVLDVPTSRCDTGRLQQERLEDNRLRVGVLPALRDIDRFDDALAVAAAAPWSRTADAVAAAAVARTTSPDASGDAWRLRRSA